LNIALKAEFKTSVEITIYNSTGQLVRKFSTVNANNTNELRLNISDLTPGVYMLRITDENQFISKSFFKEVTTDIF
jgi:hypothetical protein